MNKRLADLVDLVSNNKQCAVLAVKESTQPLDLIKLGGFDGDETMFRVSKNRNTITVTVFRDDRPPYSMDYGSSTTLVLENEKAVRDQVRECVNLDFGIFTNRPFHGQDFDRLVEATNGLRTLDSERRFELQWGNEKASFFVNGQHIALIDVEKFETWKNDRNVRLEVNDADGSIDYGFVRRAKVPERDHSLDTLKAEAKDRAAEKNAEHNEQTNSRKPPTPDMDR